jgi:solute:Na+ symporter, SSS family
MITLLSAAMSTLSSQFHAMGTALGRDIYEKALGRSGNSVILTKVGILFAILISYFLAWALPTFFEGGTAIIARGTAIFFGICAAAFLPMYFGALYFRNMSRLSAWACFFTGTTISLFWLFFVHAKESKPLMVCNALFGVDSLGAGTLWAVVDPLVIALPASALVTILFNLKRNKSYSKQHIERCFHNMK